MSVSACLNPQSGFQFDPAKMRPQRLKLTVREAAKQYEHECGLDDLRRGRSGFRKLFVTLTYAANTRGNKRDVSECINRMRQWAGRLGVQVRYVWVAEVQKRGALHYHLLIWLPRALHLPKLDKRGWWPHGMTKVETARNPVGYLCKYASKCRPDDLKRLRKGTRLYGYGGGWSAWRETLREKLRGRWICKTREAERDAAWLAHIEAEIAEQEREEAATLHQLFPDEYPPPPELYEEPDEEAEYYAQRASEEDQARRRDALLRVGRALLARVTGGYADRVTGEFYESPYFVTVERGLVTVYRKSEVCCGE